MRADVLERDGADAVIQRCRRVDWRFLLPDPELGRVAYVGTPQPTHRAALELVSELFVALEPQRVPVADDLHAAFDVVVVERATPHSLERAADVVRPDGWVYLELGPRRARRAAAALERAGFTDVTAHWHWPTFADCLEIVPLADGAALRHALSRRVGSRRARAKARLARLAVMLGVFPLTIRNVSVVARRSAQDA